MTQTAFFSFFVSSLSIAGIALACDGGSATAKKEAPPATAKVTEASANSKPSAAAVRGAASEAKLLLRQIADRAHAVRLESPKSDSLSMAPAARAYPPSVKMTPAAGSCCASGGQCTSTAATWADAGWDRLGFSIEDRHFFTYSFELVGEDAFLATASGDPDCDGTVDVYEISGSMGAGDQPKTSKVAKRE